MTDTAPVFARENRIEQIAKIALPVTVLLASVGLWEYLCWLWDTPFYKLPRPSLIFTTLINDWPTLSTSLWVTLRTTFLALILAVVGGVGIAILFTRSKWIELTFYPYAVVLQVTPIIAIAPLMLIYLDVNSAVLLCAWIVAFFPILSNTTLGLLSADHNLRSLFELYRASGWQTLWYLKLRAALPYFLSGLKIGGGLSLIGAIVGEFTAGTGGQGSGLAYRILESQYRLNIPRLFAALMLISFTGICIFLVLSLLSHLLLRKWHESAVRREN
ncbi:ABC transporter permease [Terrarubrum flagellatum]|uniref:ABC transporter permease n=1 Tax=Terrirubrum flagellatum TaxID=2895980 RepID=UPI0031455029